MRSKTIPSIALTLCLLPQPSDGAPNRHGTCGVQGVGTTSLDFAAVLASPNTNRLPLHCILATELAEILAVLCNLHFLNLLTQTGTISGTILADNANLLRALGLHKIENICQQNQFLVSTTNQKLGTTLEFLELR